MAAALFYTRVAASLGPCGVRMRRNELCVHVNMHEALCRHVKQNLRPGVDDES